MNRGSDSFTWGIRWETIERHAGEPLYGALLPETYPSLGDAQRQLRVLAETQPELPNPAGGAGSLLVRYVVFARHPEDVDGL